MAFRFGQRQVGDPSVQQNFEQLEGELDSLSAAVTVTVTQFPSAPSDGQEVDLLVDSAGTYGGPYLWRCKYRSATVGSYKWHVIASPELFIDAVDNPGGFTLTTYVAFGPTLTIPVAGDYDITPYTNALYKYSTTGQGYVSFKVGAAAASDLDAINQYSLTSQDNVLSQQVTRRKNGIAANTALRLAARTGAGTIYPTQGLTNQPYGLRARPVRLG